MITLPSLATIKARVLAALNNNALQCQKPGFEPLKGCAYSGPCAVGAALRPNQIRVLKDKGFDEAGIGGLIDKGTIRINPKDDDHNLTRTVLRALQDAHDWGDTDTLRKLLETP